MSKNYFFFITCLEAGGAQRAMLQLIRHIKKVESYANIHVINLSQEGEELQESLYSYSTSLINLNLKNFSFFKIYSLIKLIRDNHQKSILIGWMYHAGVVAWFCSLFAKKIPLVFSIHHSGLDSKNLSIRTLFVAYFMGLISLSKRVKKIFFCAESSLNAHVNARYPKKKSIIIFNGVEKVKYQPALRIEKKQIFKIVMAARFDPIKNHENLFAAIKTIKNNIPISLSLFGEKITNDNEDLKVLIKKYSLKQEIKLEGVDPMLRDKFSNYDLLALPSNSEAFPLVIPEAMISGLPCVASSVGDVPSIIGEYGWLVSPKDSTELSFAITEAYNAWLDKEKWVILQANCRKRIEENFSSQKFCEAYYDSLSSL